MYFVFKLKDDFRENALLTLNETYQDTGYLNDWNVVQRDVRYHFINCIYLTYNLYVM